jgi:phage terminase large subunit-like protein
MELWDGCSFHIDVPALKGRKCYGGLDLSSTNDMTAFVLCFPPLDEDDKYILLPFFWIPEAAMHKRVVKDHVPYDQWEASGFLDATEGEVINYNFVQKKLEDLNKDYDIEEIAFDRWGAHLLRQNLEDAGFEMGKFGQGYESMSPASKELMRLTLEKKIAHGGNPILRWNFDNIVVKQDEAGNIKPDKQRATEKIDGAVASIMALDRALRHSDNHNVYKERGMLMIDFSHPDGYYYSK